MAGALVIALAKYGLLALLWLFVFAAVRVVRNDLAKPAPALARPPAPPRPARAARRTTPRRTTPRQMTRRRGSAPRALVVTEGQLLGATVPLGDQAITLGRAEDCTLVLADDYASSHHARLVPDGDTWLLEDLSSTNGTYLASVKVSRPTLVAVGQQIKIGKTSLELRR